MGYSLQKGKLNRIKVGQKVRAKPSLVDWFASHLSWSYGRKPIDASAYGIAQNEIGVQDLGKVYAWSGAKLGKEMPVGVVEYYGQRDNDQGIDRNNVFVTFTFKTQLGSIIDKIYVNEKDLVVIRKKKSK